MSVVVICFIDKFRHGVRDCGGFFLDKKFFWIDLVYAISASIMHVERNGARNSDCPDHVSPICLSWVQKVGLTDEIVNRNSYNPCCNIPEQIGSKNWARQLNHVGQSKESYTAITSCEWS